MSHCGGEGKGGGGKEGGMFKTCSIGERGKGWAWHEGGCAHNKSGL